jgi:hypothetical protein
MNNTSETTLDQTEAFQKIWLESMSKLMQTAFTFGQGSPPPEILRQIRSGILQALAQSWDEFLRSPQFLEGTKQWMDQAIAFRKTSNDFMAHVRNEFQSTSRDDIDTVLLAVQHMEQRVLDRVEELSAKVDSLRERPAKGPANGPVPSTVGSNRQPAKPSRKLPRGKGKMNRL